MDGAESGDLKNWTQFGDRTQSGEEACCNCRVLHLVSTGFVFPSVPCPIVVAMMLNVETIGDTVFC